ncbi:MAG: hypothetical protein ACTHMK_13720 [Dyella sp.]|uniref:hypothetical protein n=1 Tax=Dyella sp. TaxID=1869338 RepID=UPI003F81EFC9
MNTTSQTLDMLKANYLAPNELSKSISTATGLVAYDLQAPAKNLYPVITPIRNSMPRVKGKGGTATNWKAVTGIIGSGFEAGPWVPEGQRAARMSYNTEDKAASYVTIGEEDSLTFEARSAAEGFEDVRSSMTMRLLQKTMIKEERAIIGGNRTLALGTPGTPTLSASGTGATLPAATYSVICVALTFEGYINSSLAAGVATSKVVTGADGNTFTLNGGSSNKSTNATQAVTLGQTLFASVAPVQGALGYAWFVGTAGSEKLEAITTINSAAFSAPLAGTGQAATSITADCSRNTSYAFDGLLSAALNPANSAYVKVLPTGVAGTGTPLTSSGRGSVVEIDDMLKGLWDEYRVSPTKLYVGSQVQQDITDKVLNGASAPLLRFNTDGKNPYGIVANGVVEYYFNPFAMGGGNKIPVELHPDVPPGMIFAHCENLPAQYQSNNVPNVAEVHLRQDYYEIEWPLRTRQYEHGVYAEETLAIYAAFCFGIITNIAKG